MKSTGAPSFFWHAQFDSGSHRNRRWDEGGVGVWVRERRSGHGEPCDEQHRERGLGGLFTAGALRKLRRCFAPAATYSSPTAT
eukprot:3723808-Pleurochrysis_carterae.AAC.2